MREVSALVGILALLLLTGLSAVGEETADSADVEDPWAEVNTSKISSMVEVKDISGTYADITEGGWIEARGENATAHPYEEEEGTYIWTIEQHGSIVTGTIESSEGESYKILGSTTMDELCLVYFGLMTNDETNSTYEMEGFLDGKILESGQIVLNGLGYEYTLDPEDVNNYTFDGYFTETTILTPIEE